MWTQYSSLPRAVHILCIGALINRAGSFLAPFLTIYLQKKLGFGVTFATQAMGVYGAGALIALLLGGDLADRVGRRIIMVVALFGSAAFMVVFGLLTSKWMILGALLVFSPVAEMYRPAASAMIADLTTPATRPHAFSLMYVAINLGFAVAAFVGGYVAQFSFNALFWGDAATSSIYGIIVLWAIRETLPSRQSKGAGHDSPKQKHAAEVGMGIMEVARYILSDWVFILYWFGSFFLAVMYIQAFVTLPLYLDSVGIDLDVYGRVIALNGVTIVFVQLPLTSWVSRFHRGTMIALSALITALGFGLTGVAVGAWQFAFTVLVWTFGEMINSPLMSAVVADLAPVRLRGRYMGVYSICFSAAMIIGAPLGGVVLGRFGGRVHWNCVAGIGLVAAIMYGVVRYRVTSASNGDSPP